MTGWLLWLTALVVPALLWLAWRRGSNLAADFEHRRTETLAQPAGPPAPVLTEALIKPLPVPV